MQGYAEGFELLHKSEYGLDLEKIAKLWGQGSVIRSWLLELAARAFEADGNDLSNLEGYVEDSGEGRWTLGSGIDHDVPMPALAAALCSPASPHAATATTRRACWRRCATSSAATRSRARRGRMQHERSRRRAAAARRGQPARRGARAAAGSAHRAGDLRRHGGPRASQAAARALQPRPRGRAARALRADRRGAPRPGRTRTSRRSRASRSSASRAASPIRTCSTACSANMRYVAGTFDDDNVYERDRQGPARVRRAGRRAAQPRLLPLDRAGVLPRHLPEARRRQAPAVRARPRRGS